MRSGDEIRPSGRPSDVVLFSVAKGELDPGRALIRSLVASVRVPDVSGISEHGAFGGLLLSPQMSHGGTRTGKLSMED